jgi:hypothetical protein
MMHLSKTELLRWHSDGTATDRQRLMTHLALCPACAAALAEIVRTSPTDADPLAFDPKDFASRGATFAPTATSDGTLRGYWPLAAAAVLVLSVGAVLWPRAEPIEMTSTLRGADAAVSLVRPDDNADTAVPRDQLVFEWISANEDLLARLVVTSLSAPDRPAISRPNVRSGYRPSSGELAALTPGVTYRWFVEYRADDGVHTTPTRRFRVE